VKRTAAMPGVSTCKVKTVPPAALRIHSAAARPTPRRAPSSFLLHSAGRTQPRQTRCAGLPVKGTPQPRSVRCAQLHSAGPG
jgi:hypothetical protein